TYIDAGGEKFLDPRVKRAGVWVADDRHLRAAQELHKRLKDGGRMMRQRAALPTTTDGFGCHHFEGLHAGVADIIEQHRNILAEILREIEAESDVLPGCGLTGFDPGNAADNVGAELHRFLHQPVGAGLAHNPVLRKSDYLKVDNAAELLAHRQECLDALKASLAI